MNHRRLFLVLPITLLVLLPTTDAVAQNRDHPGLVHLGEGEWGTPEQARELGLIENRGRWWPAKLEKSLKKWERLDAKGLEWKDAYKERTKYYRVRTNVPRSLFHLEIAPFLDSLGDTFTRVFQDEFGLKGKAVKNKDLKIYRSFEEYSQGETDSGRGRPRTNPGFIVNGAELVVFYEETDPALFYGAVLHEGAHQFFLSLLPGANLPIWLDEGLATWFEGATYSRATHEIDCSGVPATRLRNAKELLAANSGSPQEMFMEVPQESFTAEHYALAWSFLHYLLERPGQDNAEKFARFLEETNGSGVKPIPEVYAKATKEDFAEVSKGWRGHVTALELPGSDPRWIRLTVEPLTVEPSGEDLRSGDLVWSLDGHEVFDVQQFNELWKNRSKDRPAELVLVRCEPSYQDPYAKRSFVRTTVAPDSKTTVTVESSFSRHANLRD